MHIVPLRLVGVGLAIAPNKIKPPSNALGSSLFQRLLPKSLVLREGLQKIAQERNVSQAQIDLNWCRAHGAIPIPGIELLSKLMKLLKR